LLLCDKKVVGVFVRFRAPLHIELPIKISSSFTAYPMFRYYPNGFGLLCYEKHLSTEKYYTSDYDLSKFSNQYGLGFTYTDILLVLKSLF
jgi:hypothetical protein